MMMKMIIPPKYAHIAKDGDNAKKGITKITIIIKGDNFDVYKYQCAEEICWI